MAIDLSKCAPVVVDAYGKNGCTGFLLLMKQPSATLMDRLIFHEIQQSGNQPKGKKAAD